MSIYESYNKLNILKNLLQNTFEKKLSNLEKHNKSHFDSISYSIEECNLYAKKCLNYQKYLIENSLNNNNYANYNTSNNYLTKSPIKTKRTFSRTKTPIKSNNNTSRLSQSKSNLAIHDKFSRKEKSNNKLNKTIIGKSNTNKNLLTIHNNNVHQRFSVNISNNNIPIFNNNTNNKRINGHRKTLSSITTCLTTNVHSKENVSSDAAEGMEISFASMVHLIRSLFEQGEIRRMELKIIKYPLTICKVKSIADTDLSREFFFIGKTDEEISLVCITDDTPEKTLERDDGWRGFRIQGILDFSLIGILSKLSGILAENKIGIFAVSTYNTDYILVKEENFEKAVSVLEKEGYSFVM